MAKLSTLSPVQQKKQILKQLGLDFTIEKHPVTLARRIDEKTVEYVKTEDYGLYNSKSGEVIKTGLKKGYAVSQNDDVLELVLKGMEGFGDLSIQKGGSIHGGRKVYFQLGIEGHGKVGNDTIKRYVTVIDSNDGSTGLSVGIGDLTMSCQNQFFRFYKEAQSKLRHTDSLAKRMIEIPHLIEFALSQSLRQIELYNAFESTSITKDLAHQMVQHLLGIDRVLTDENILMKKPKSAIEPMDALYRHIEKETNQKGMNLWGLHSGITSWTSHEKSYPKRINGQIEGIVTERGTNYKTNNKSLEFCAEYAGLELVY